MIELRGVVTALVTPLLRDQDLCTECLKSMIEFQLSKGVDGFFIMGTYGEGVILPPTVRKRYMSAIIDLVPSKNIVIAHIGSADIETALDLAMYAKDLGFHVVSSIGPLFHKPSKQGIINFYKHLAKVDVGILVYNNKGRQGYNISPEIFEELTAEIPNIVGIKDTSYDVAQLQEYVERFSQKYFIAGAGDELMAYAFLLGVHAHICGIANAFPELAVAIYRAVKSNDIGKALKLQRIVNRIRAILKRFNVEMAELMREILRIRGIDAGFPPKQVGGLEQNQGEELRRVIYPFIKEVEVLR